MVRIPNRHDPFTFIFITIDGTNCWISWYYTNALWKLHHKSQESLCSYPRNQIIRAISKNFRSIRTSTCACENHINTTVTVPVTTVLCGGVTTWFPMFAFTPHIIQCDSKRSHLSVKIESKKTISPVCCFFVSHFSADSTSRVVTKVILTHGAPLIEQHSSLTWWCIFT